jgi:hypothetical protein
MAKLTIGQKGQRVLTFVVGLREPQAAEALAAHGFTEADLQEGLDHVGSLTRKRLSMQVQVEDPRVIKQLDEFENRWFPIARYSLNRHFPDVAQALFLNLTQTEGVEVAVSVSIFVERLEAMAAGDASFGANGPAARALLARRGLTAERVGDARTLLDQLGTLSGEPRPELSVEEQRAAEEALWSWYLEWSGIARTVISDRRVLRRLGFRRGGGGSRINGSGNGELDGSDGESPDAAESATPAVESGAGPASTL